MKPAFSILICTILCIQLNGQCHFKNNTFVPGELVSYNVYYNIGFLWFDAAFVNFKISDTTINSVEAYKFSSFGATKPNYDWVYKVRDYYESHADVNTLSPLYFSRNTSEGSYSVHNTYRFNYSDSTIYSSITNNKDPHYKDTLQIKDCTLDVLTAIYACRSINVDALEKNDTIPLKMLINNEFYNLHLRYLGKEKATLEDERVYNCNKFSILLVEGTIFSGGEELYVWISDDKAKIPICIEAKILVGSIIAQLYEVTGNNWPLDSMVKNNSKE